MKNLKPPIKRLKRRVGELIMSADEKFANLGYEKLFEDSENVKYKKGQVYIIMDKKCGCYTCSGWNRMDFTEAQKQIVDEKIMEKGWFTNE